MRSPAADAMSELAPEWEPLVPPLVLAAYIACVAGAGALANCALAAALLKRSKNGLFSIIIQLAFADFILLGTSIGPELWSCNARTWDFGRGACIAYRGLSIFASTASLYLVITIALHTLATVNLEEKAFNQKKKRTDDEDEEIRSSRHSLVANSDSSTPPRTMNVDYRLTDKRVPITPPSTFVWVLSASLSVPEFALATTVRLDPEVVVCTLVDSSHKLNMHSMLAVFNLLLPTLIISTATVLIIVKLKSKKMYSQMDNNDSVAALKLSLSLIVVYCVLCAPRTIAYVYGVYSTSTSDNGIELTQQNNIVILINLIFSSTYLAATFIRPILCIVLLPRLRRIFIFGFKNTEIDNV